MARQETKDGKVDPALVQACDECDGFAGVYPEHKHRIVTALQAKGRLVGMTGARRVLCVCLRVCGGVG